MGLEKIPAIGGIIKGGIESVKSVLVAAKDLAKVFQKDEFINEENAKRASELAAHGDTSAIDELLNGPK